MCLPMRASIATRDVQGLRSGAPGAREHQRSAHGTAAIVLHSSTLALLAALKRDSLVMKSTHIMLGHVVMLLLGMRMGLRWSRTILHPARWVRVAASPTHAAW